MNLIEEIVVENQNEINVHGQDSEQIYPMNGIKVDKGFYTVFELKRKYDAKNKRIILDSDFQRDDVWKAEQKAELVESVLMGLPLPIFYFNQDKYGRLIVIDGRQRLTALFEYMNDEFALKDLKILSEINTLKFSDLPPVYMSRLEDYQIQAHVILPPTPDRIKFDIFDRVNRGGMKLNKQEIRNALYQGKSTQMLNRIVKGELFQAATGNAFVNEKRMKDKYLVTRFVTCYLFFHNQILDDNGNIYIYKGDIDDFLGRGMDAVNHMQDDEIEKLEYEIEQTLKKSIFYLGADAFRLKDREKKTPINMNVFETVMFALLWVSDGKSTKKEDIRAKIRSFIESDEFRNNIGSRRDEASRLQWRLREAEILGRTLEKVFV